MVNAHPSFEQRQDGLDLHCGRTTYQGDWTWAKTTIQLCEEVCGQDGLGSLI